jgi:peptidyl-prolyl cis-trans isomerase C
MRRRTLSALAALAGMALIGCGEPAATAPLATVNGVDIRMLAQPAAQPDPSRVEALIDSQLLQEAAIRNKLDRDPLVLRAIAQANAEILSKAYLQSKAAALAAPTRAEIDAYLAAHPDLFSERKLFLIEQLVFDSKDFTAELKQRIDRAASVEQVAKWLDAHAVHYARARLSRNSAELAPPLLAKLKSMRKQQLFVVVAGPQTTLDALQDVTPDPVPQAAALAQADAILRQGARARSDQMEIARLRALAKIDYFKQQQGSTPTTLGALPSQHKEQ